MTSYFKTPVDPVARRRAQVSRWKSSLRPRHLKGLPRRRYPKSTHKQLVDELDDVFSLFIRYRDNFKCICAGHSTPCGGPIQNGHLITRGKGVLRWDERNCHAQCRDHNYLHEDYPGIYENAYIKLHGLAAWQKLQDEAWRWREAKYSERQLTGMILYYKQELRRRFGVEVLTRR